MMVASIRYLDTFVKTDGRWLISQRKAMVCWTESRSLATAANGCWDGTSRSPDTDA
jgi:hypothetical protein